jgi:hypothetical protein
MGRTLDIMGLKEVANSTGVPVGTISAWLTRGHMPEPEARLACGPIWRSRTIADWVAGDGAARIERSFDRARAT